MAHRDLDAKLRFYEMGEIVDQPREATLAGVARWHDDQAAYYEGGIFIEGANLAVTPTRERGERNRYRKLLTFYEAERAFHAEAAALIRRATLRVAT